MQLVSCFIACVIIVLCSLVVDIQAQLPPGCDFREPEYNGTIQLLGLTKTNARYMVM